MNQGLRVALVATGTGAVTTHGLYWLLGRGDPLATLGRLVVILLAMLLVWRGRQWARWVLVLFLFGAVVGFTSFAVGGSWLVPTGLLLAAGNLLFIGGVLALFSRPISAQITPADEKTKGADPNPLGPTPSR